MRIKLKRTWFAPDTSGHTTTKYVGRNGRPVARGSRLRKGYHDVPEEWRDLLPSDTVIVADDYEEPPEERPEAPQPTLHAGAAFVAALQAQSLANVENDQAEKMEAKRAAQAKTNRQEGAARARAAKQQKQEKANA